MNRITQPELDLHTFHGIVTVAPEMLHLFELMRRAARSDATVLVRGESGTGKERVATTIHELSPRSRRPFRAVNCATFTPELLASELFGHVRGAFTGAVQDKAGLFSQADTGTLFLDEVAELPLELQARLLRVIQERSFTPVGATREHQVDVRLVCATNAALREWVARGRFREDLMYRIRVVVLYLPRLMEREGDLEALTWYFITTFNQHGFRQVHAIDADAWEAMRNYPWPGNVRELRNNIEQAFVLGEGPTLRLHELTPELQGDTPPRKLGTPGEPPRPATVADIQREQLIAAIRQHGGRRERVAEQLGISRSTLYRRLKRYGLS